jgi:uncharacterized cupredoxin-like copper-binding protein
MSGARRGFSLFVMAVLALAAVSILSVAATGAFDDQASAPASDRCRVPPLPGTVVSVRLVDMRSMMTRPPMMGGHGAMMSQRDWRSFRPGMMRLIMAPTEVPHGTVSFAVTNRGFLTHELVVLPLPAGQLVGSRMPGANGKVSETGGLGEASASCAGGAGDGITPGSVGWVTLRLPPGRYELICNLPGHYTAGMDAELDVR